MYIYIHIYNYVYIYVCMYVCMLHTCAYHHEDHEIPFYCKEILILLSFIAHFETKLH